MSSGRIHNVRIDDFNTSNAGREIVRQLLQNCDFGAIASVQILTGSRIDKEQFLDNGFVDVSNSGFLYKILTTGSKRRQVHDTILAGIKNGHYPTGTALPAVTKLASQLTSDTTTIHEVLDYLEQAGALFRSGKSYRVKEVCEKAESSIPSKFEDRESFSIKLLQDLWHSGV